MRCEFDRMILWPPKHKSFLKPSRVFFDIRLTTFTDYAIIVPSTISFWIIGSTGFKGGAQRALYPASEAKLAHSLFQILPCCHVIASCAIQIQSSLTDMCGLRVLKPK